MDKTPLSALFVEDSEVDATLTLRFLEKAGYDVVWERVEDGEAMRAALDRRVWDVVISDYNLPQFDAPSALALVQQSGKDIPFIVVSGAIGEETAAALVKAGAHDYILKNNLSRLPGSVARELSRAQDREAYARAEVALREREQEYRMLFEKNLDAIVWINADTLRIIKVNPAAERLFEAPNGGMVGRVNLEFHPPDIKTHFIDEFLECGRTGQKSFATEILTATGRRVPVEVFPLIVEIKDIKIYQGLFHDITEHRRVEEQMRAAKEAAEATSKAKSEFLANISHELRTPLTAVIGFTDLLLLSDMSNEQRQYAEIVHKRGSDLLNIISDLLDLTKIEADKLVFEDTELDIVRVVNDAIDNEQMAASAKGLAIKLSVAQDIPNMLKGDSLRLKQILINLLSNAVKFTDSGEIEISVARRGEQPDGYSLMFSVRDTGVGIPADKQGLVFNPFYQVDGSNSKKCGGTGLGLTICQRFVSRMGGRIWLESELGKGTTFRFTVPLKEGRHEIEPAPVAVPPATSRSYRILVAEDDLISAQLASKILSDAGHKVVLASNGHKTIEAVLREPMDIVFMDIRMPDMDGIDAVREIRRLESNGKLPGSHRLHIIAFTAFAMHGDRERFMAAGMDGYISKPMLSQELLDAVAESKV